MKRVPLLQRLGRDQRGAALMEFAFTAPLVLALGLYGVEMGNQALTHMRLSQIALNLADNASRSSGIPPAGVYFVRPSIKA